MASTVSKLENRKHYSLKKLVRGSSSRVLRMVTLAIIGFFIMPFTVHKLGAQQYGIWAIAMILHRLLQLPGSGPFRCGLHPHGLRVWTRGS